MTAIPFHIALTDLAVSILARENTWFFFCVSISTSLSSIIPTSLQIAANDCILHDGVIFLCNYTLLCCYCCFAILLLKGIWVGAADTTPGEMLSLQGWLAGYSLSGCGGFGMLQVQSLIPIYLGLSLAP